MNTNIYFLSNSESFKIQKLKQIEAIGFWRVDDKTNSRNADNFPYDKLKNKYWKGFNME